MGGAWQSEEVAALTAPVDLSQRIIYFPVRHHSPACAWHVGRLIRDVRPDAVLIEGPRDATPLIPLLLHAETRFPVAIYATYVRRRADGAPDRFAAYYPVCEFSPEHQAIVAAAEVGAATSFIDLTFPEKVQAGAAEETPKKRRVTQSMQEESWFNHSQLLQAACVRTGSRDPDDLWDHLYEVDYKRVPADEFIRRVLAYCTLARKNATQHDLKADGTLARERAMAHAIAQTTGKVVVVTGGFHTVTLAETKPSRHKSLKVKPEDNQLVLMRYSFDQLDRLNGYASGMPSPEFYQRVWEDEDLTRLMVQIARACRKRNMGVSTADAIAGYAHAQRLAALRGHAALSREDLLDGVRSVFIKGADDMEGTAVLSITRKLLAGDRVGAVPKEAGQPPIVHDFRNTATRLKIKLDKLDGVTATLDLYRKVNHREISRLFYRLDFLEIPFADFVRGPDFVAGQELERIQEVWNYCWSPRTESTLIERSLYGGAIEEAASSMLLERFHEAETQGQGRSAALATELVLHACRMGLHRHTQDLLARVNSMMKEDSVFDSLVAAIENLLVLEVSREPLEAHHLTGLHALATTGYHRACYLLPSLVNTAAEEEVLQLDALNALIQAARTLGDTPEFQQLRVDGLNELANSTGGSAAMRGGAVGLLQGEGVLDEEQVVAHLRGHLLSSRDEGVDGPNFLRGLLKTARSILWQTPGILDAVNEVLRSWDEEQFIKLLPLLRLALSDLTPRETDRVAKSIAGILGAESLQLDHLPDMSSEEMLRAVDINRRVQETLAADGLEEYNHDPTDKT